MMWFSFGEHVLGKLVGKDRSRTVSIVYQGAPPAIDEIRKTLRLTEDVSLDVRSELPVPVCNLDEYVCAPDGEIFACIHGPQVVWTATDKVRMLTQDLCARDFIRLWFWKETYPELGFDPSLARRLDSEVEYLWRERSAYPEVELYFRLYESGSRSVDLSRL